MKSVVQSTRILVAAIISIFFAAAAQAQDAFEKFSSYDAENTQAIDYRPMDEFFTAISEKSRDRQNFKYSLLGPQGIQILDGYINFLSGISPVRFNKDEQLAYWLNLRNLLVLREITAISPVRNLKDERGTEENPGELWTKKVVTVDDVVMSINDVEQKIIIANWKQPEVFYGLYQGIKSGPAFSPAVSFTGNNVNGELTERASAYINGRRTLKVKGDNVEIPAVYSWYKSAMFGDDANLIQHLRTHADKKLADKLSAVTSVSFAKVNYSLDQSQARQQRQFDNRQQRGFTGGSGS